MSRLVYGWLTAIAAALPLRLGYSLAWLLTEVHYRAFPARRHAALANLASVLPGTAADSLSRGTPGQASYFSIPCPECEGGFSRSRKR
jgi:hypothetical protein